MPSLIHDLRQNNVTGIRVWCLSCHKGSVVPFDGIPDSTPFLSLKLDCPLCKSSETELMPDWPKYSSGAPDTWGQGFTPDVPAKKNPAG